MGFVLLVCVPFGIWLFGWQNDLTTVWVPLVAWVASGVAFPFRGWLAGDRLGSNAGASIAMKLPLQIVQLTGTLFFWGSLGVLVSWFL